jgi:hypothetical protein
MTTKNSTMIIFDQSIYLHPPAKLAGHAENSYLFNEFVCNFGFFWHEWTSLKLEWNESFKGPRVPKKAQITQE